MGEEEIVIMYHYIEDKVFLKDLKYLCSNIINQLVQLINNDSLMEVKAHLVGSGAKNLITQNSNEPIDLDYNLMIIDSEININNCREIKEYIRKQFNVILNKSGWNDCMDSTSVLTTEKRHFTKGNHTEFSIDLAIVFNDRNGCHRLIHEKTGVTVWDRYYWNSVPDSRNLFDKVAAIKDEHLWDEVIDEYLEKKNMYLRRQDYNHPSFNVYVETVNQVFNEYPYPRSRFTPAPVLLPQKNHHPRCIPPRTSLSDCPTARRKHTQWRHPHGCRQCSSDGTAWDQCPDTQRTCSR